MERLDLRLLGGFEVTVDGRPVAHDAWDGRRPAQLVKMLALSPGHRLPAERVMDHLWPDLEPEAARANLHRAASRARGILGSRQAVVLSTGMVSLAPAAQRHVDVARFEAAATEALRSNDSGRCAEAADLYGGELAPEEPYEEWAVQERERLRLLHHELLRRAGRWAALVDADPTDEEAHLRLIEEHRDAGRVHAAVRQFHRLRTVLARELGVPPGPETTAVYRRILGTATHGRPRPGLVGREVEMVRARALWRRAADGRPVGLFVSGEPGIGKTRLCTELLDSATADGWLVLRAQARHQDDIVPFGPIAEAAEEAVLADDSLVGRLRPVDRDVLARLTGLRRRRGQAPMRRQAVLALLDRLARGPRSGSRAALFVDDLHAADAATLDLVGCLLASPPSHGMAVVATFRPEPANPALAELVAGAKAAGTGIELALGPLSRSEAMAIAEDVTGRTPSPEESALVWDLARGNPFFTVEIATA
ncbi:MAG TPA: AAA family ATPase, partial [Acidimicrobiales bacterium]|nr:AAA family ATPase [Acidimicrobiales bacterium]